ncbi:hypothetical protein JKF63_07704 [Porcisia hertigi]|uniref:Uncharacterized protein n=1 Tax=Porcisia hertigi TaxID=2761500 RepID=A0A836LLT5_9TRYP|nr:hypothetical protein JKF63_07704 [Porcisia hertigi]
MPYYSSGEGRDSFITGIRPGGRYGVLHDVEKRRDNLPAHIFHYIKNDVLREERVRSNEEEARARIRVEMFSRKCGHHARNSAIASAGSHGGSEQSAAMSQLERAAEVRERRAALLELYQRDREEWDMLLGERGLAAHRG